MSQYREFGHFQSCPTGRKSGRTVWMIEQLIDAILCGQPRSVVVGADQQHVGNLVKLCVGILSTRRITYERESPTVLRVCEDSVVTFLTLPEFGERESRNEFVGGGVFIDHLAAGED